MRGRGAILAATLAAACASAGCDWRTFDALQGQTPVLNIGAPSGYPAPNDFGSHLLALEPPNDGPSARYLVSADNQTAIAVVSLDAGGHPSATTVTGAALDDLNGFPVTALAEIPGAEKALLGSPQLTGGNLRLLDLTPPYAVTPFVTSVEHQLGAGVAAGTLGGGAAPDLVAVSESALHVYVDGQTTGADLYYMDSGPGDPCPITLSPDLPARIRNNRPVVIAPLLAGGGVQVAVGTPVTSGSGAVSIFDVDTTTGKATCALALHGTSGTDQRFGQALAVGDFDGDGTPDLLVGEPPKTVYLFRGPVTATPTSTITDPAGIDFGAALAAVPLVAGPGDEALIGDPDATVGSDTAAGHVVVRTSPPVGAPLTTMVVLTGASAALTPRDVHSGDGYGSALASLTFCGSKSPAADGGGGGGSDSGAPADGGAGADGGTTTACTRTKLPLVGALERVYTYFTLGAFDPRAR